MPRATPKAKPAPRKADTVARALLERIVQGEPKPGDILPNEAELAEEHGVNRSVVREAIKLLEVHRLVRPVRRRGTEVLDPFASLSPEVLDAMLVGRGGKIDLAFLESLLEIRALLDVHICGFAAERRTRADVAALEAQLAVLKSRANDPESYAEASYDFGLLLARASQNPVAVMLSHWNRAVARELGQVFGVARTATGPHLEGLALLIDRIKAKDAEQARALVRAFHDWATPRSLATAALANGEPLTKVSKLQKTNKESK